MTAGKDSRINTEKLRTIAKDEGMAVFGVAELEPIRQTFHPDIVQAAQGLKYGISAGFRLSDPTIDDIADRPTLLYKHHYKVANYTLDRAGARVEAYIQSNGYKALPIPASQTIDWEKHLGHLSHKAVAVQAGLGWIGKSALFIHPQHRARLRLVTVLTDMPLEAGSPIERSCGSCQLCIEACPAGAISDQGYDKPKCIAQLREFSRLPGIGQYICGVCVKVCRD
jgi:epoxyqueuosine reductase QueG